ncbi:anti-sigma F factor [Bengtsoniella intestinalis]|uniref:anti-sigma F factor n=1 Tax=Bengtsoniella intestinalis TaxID=3073143 RepID=UPI00391F32B8
MKVVAKNECAVSFPSRSSNEGLARGVVACFVAQADPTIHELEDIKTAVSEAVTNAIVHGYPEGIGMVYLKGRLFEDYLEISVQDKGCGIADVEQARQPMFTTGGAERSGMGITIMDSFMDNVRIRSTIGKGTVVVMKKKLAPRMKASR